MLSRISKAEKRYWNESLFSGCHKVNFRKKRYFSHFCIIFQKKIGIISDVIILIAAILKNVVHFFFRTLQSMTVPNFMSTAFSYRDLRRGWGREGGTIRQKYPGAWSDKNTTGHNQTWDKNTPGQIGLIIFVSRAESCSVS